MTGAGARSLIVSACISRDGQEVAAEGTLQRGSRTGLWVHRPFGLHDPAEGAFVRVEGDLGTLKDGDRCAVLGTWSKGRIVDARRDTRHSFVPIVIHADSALPTRFELTVDSAASAHAAVSRHAGNAQLSSGAYRDRLFASLLYLPEKTAQWWLAFRAAQMDLGVAIVPTRLWAVVKQEPDQRIVGRPGANKAELFNLTYGPGQ